MSEIDCKLCDNSGWVSQPGSNQAHNCQCRPLRHLNMLMDIAFIPPRYRNQTLDMIQPENPTQAAALTQLSRYASAWPDHRRAGDGVALIGSTSRAGKSHMACALARTIAAHNELPYEPGEKYPILFLNISEFINGWRTFYAQPKAPEGQGDSRHWDSYKRLMALEQRALTCPLLILDEIGEASGTEFVTQKLYAIIEHRCSHLLPLIFTSNLDWSQLAQRYGDGGARIVGRLQEMTDQFTIQL